MKAKKALGFRQEFFSATFAVTGKPPCTCEIIRTNPESLECKVVVETPDEGQSFRFDNINAAFEFVSAKIYYSKNEIPPVVTHHG